jgi:hypothetical protein
VTWLPVDAAATAILDTVKHPGSIASPVAYLNLVHPRSTPWDDIFKPAADRLQLDFVSYDKWVELLGPKNQVLANGDHEASAELAGYLSSGQLGSGKFRMDVTLEKCPSLKGVKALEGVDLIKSLDFWKL